MKIANVAGRLTLVGADGGIDVETASAGRFGPDPQAVYGQWSAFREWAEAPRPGSARHASRPGSFARARS
jgi:hypothetical protein